MGGIANESFISCNNNSPIYVIVEASIVKKLIKNFFFRKDILPVCHSTQNTPNDT